MKSEQKKNKCNILHLNKTNLVNEIVIAFVTRGWIHEAFLR